MFLLSRREFIKTKKKKKIFHWYFEQKYSFANVSCPRSALLSRTVVVADDLIFIFACKHGTNLVRSIT